MTTPDSLIELVARAYRRLVGSTITLPPDYYDRERAVAFIKALDKEGLEIRPKSLGADMIASEEGS